MMLVRLDATGTEALPQYRKYQPDVTLRFLKKRLGARPESELDRRWRAGSLKFLLPKTSTGA
jgi:hypothetical protein